MRLKVLEPFRGFKPFYADFNCCFNGVEESSRNSPWQPSVDVCETDTGFVLKADLPGLNKEDITIDINNDVLTLKGEKRFEDQAKKDGYVRVERRYGSFSRTFSLSDNVDTDNVTANYKDGVLEITLPKQEEVKPKEIQIQVN